MNETQWLSAADSLPMLEYLNGKVPDRKFRLFAVACCHRLTPLMDRSRDRWFQGAVSATEEMLEESSGSQSAVPQDYTTRLNRPENVIHCVSDPDAQRGATQAARATAELASWVSDEWRIRAERTIQARRLRCIIGNPFRPVVIDPSWLTFTVVALSNGIYNEKAFDQLPILADALQDAGCDNDAVLDHCRLPGTHVRGCWVIDALLGKE